MMRLNFVGVPTFFVLAGGACALCVACSSRSGAESRPNVAEYCDRVCNCANAATEECVSQCSDDFAAESKTLGDACLTCVQTTACDAITTDCQDTCGGLTSNFPDAGPPPSPDGGVPGCPTGRIDAASLCLLSIQAFCDARVQRCGLADDLEECVQQNLALYMCSGEGDYQCDVDPSLACVAAIEAAPCNEFGKELFFILTCEPEISHCQPCADAFGTCCSTTTPSFDGGVEGEAEGEGE